MKCKTLFYILTLWIALNAIFSPLNSWGYIVYAEAPESPTNSEILRNNPILAWKLYLYTRLLEEGFEYKDFKKLRKIAYCESRWRQYNKNGEVLRGTVNRKDIGLFQISMIYWKDEAEQLNINIFEPNGNIDMAIQIYKNHGTDPWKWSKMCWQSF